MPHFERAAVGGRIAAVAPARDKGGGNRRVAEVEGRGVVSDAPRSQGAVFQLSAPQFSSSQAWIPVSTWPKRPPGTATRTRTG
jgi:hypothetical protein